ncbi:MAG TPA: diaminopimelate epimerase [Gammaproteobacteria bacterium]|nr:diaminopimelate epimerase [Gammaproteobacteria bacterium]
MKLAFTKMNGAGNDVMVVPWPSKHVPPSADVVRRWGDRRRGVGFDQLLLVDSEHHTDGADATYRIFNADGSEVEQCGNGVRCLASFLAPQLGTELKLVSPAGVIAARVESPARVSVDLGVPNFKPAELPFVTPAERERYRLDLAGRSVEFGAVSMGNPHAVIAVDSVAAAPVEELGPALQRHASFPRSVNVGFMERLDSQRIRLRVYERGVGETLACGTGAAAAVAVGRRWGVLGEKVAVELPGGTLEVNWPGPGAPLWQTGPTAAVYEGYIEL